MTLKMGKFSRADIPERSWRAGSPVETVGGTEGTAGREGKAVCVCFEETIF